MGTAWCRLVSLVLLAKCLQDGHGDKRQGAAPPDRQIAAETG